MRTTISSRRLHHGALAKAAGGAATLATVSWALASRLVMISKSVDVDALRAGTPTMSTLAPLIEAPLVGIGCIIAAWWTLSLVLVALSLAGHAVGIKSALLASCIRAVAPAAVRRLAVAGISAGLVLSAGPALAAEPVPDLGWVSTGTSTPDAASPNAVDALAPEQAPPITPDPPTADRLTTSPAPPAAEAPLPGPAPSADTTTMTVSAGDTLWSITARSLPAGTADSTIAARWPDLYATNAATIGSDPDVILVGQELVLPGTPLDP